MQSSRFQKQQAKPMLFHHPEVSWIFKSNLYFMTTGDL